MQINGYDDSDFMPSGKALEERISELKRKHGNPNPEHLSKVDLSKNPMYNFVKNLEEGDWIKILTNSIVKGVNQAYILKIESKKDDNFSTSVTVINEWINSDMHPDGFKIRKKYEDTTRSEEIKYENYSFNFPYPKISQMPLLDIKRMHPLYAYWFDKREELERDGIDLQKFTEKIDLGGFNRDNELNQGLEKFLEVTPEKNFFLELKKKNIEEVLEKFPLNIPSRDYTAHPLQPRSTAEMLELLRDFKKNYWKKISNHQKNDLTTTKSSVLFLYKKNDVNKPFKFFRSSSVFTEEGDSI
jgi:hypothetical protein